MQRVPKPGASSIAFNNFCMLASPGASSLKGDRNRGGQSDYNKYIRNILYALTLTVWDSLYLMKVTWSSYIQGCSSRLGYFPNGGTMRLKTRAMQTNTAGRTI